MRDRSGKNWEQRYEERNTPWEEDEPSLLVEPYLDKYKIKKGSFLDIGCGLGMNARWFAEKGLDVEGCDISSACIEHAKEITANANQDNKPSFFQADFLHDPLEKEYDYIFDRGCFHSFTDQETLGLFARRVFRGLTQEGLWISLSGSSDNLDDLTRRISLDFPRLSLTRISQAVEPYFEIQEVQKVSFGKKNSFLAWLCIMKKRQNFNSFY